MIVFVVNGILMYLIDALVVGIAFFGLKSRYQWSFSPGLCFVILVLIFSFLGNYLWPMVYVLDVTYTVGNEEVAQLFDFQPNEPFIDLYGLGLAEFITWGVQALVALFIGRKVIGDGSVDAI